MKKPRDPVGKPWFYDRSKFVRSEEDRAWKERWSEPIGVPAEPVPVIAAAPEVIVPAPAPVLAPVVAVPAESLSSPNTESTPTAPSVSSVPLWRRLWNALKG